MEMKHHVMATSAAAGSSSCPGTRQGSSSWLSHRRGWAFGGGALVVGTAVALSQHWLAVAALTPLLFVLPCAVMMFMCMKGMGHGQHNATLSSASDKTSVSTDTAKQ